LLETGSIYKGNYHSIIFFNNPLQDSGSETGFYARQTSVKLLQQD